jgi:hypothetical protein
VVVVSTEAESTLRAALPEAVLAGEVLPAAELGRRYVEAPLRVAA